jgi:putative ABC transport system ATP-binding protein
MPTISPITGSIPLQLHRQTYCGDVLDAVLGVSMTPTSVRTVLVAGAKADGVVVSHGNLDIAHDADLPSGTRTEQIISTILVTREAAAGGGYQVRSTGVTWLDVAAATALREGLATRRVDNVLLVSPFASAIALARAAGESAGHDHTALLCIEPDVATVAVVGADGVVVDVRRRFLPHDDDEAVGALVEIVRDADAMEGGPQGVFVVGSGVDIPLIMPALVAATSLSVSGPEQPETALARGAALASANTEPLTSSAIELARTAGRSAGYTHIALLCIEPDSATSAVLSTDDESIAEVRRRFLPSDDAAALTALVEIVKGAEAMEGNPQGLFLLGSGIDVPLIMPDLVAATPLPISTPEQPSVGPARGAALASANSSSLASSAVALARAQGESAGYDSTALLCIEPDTATLAVVGTADGLVIDLRRRFLPHDDDEAVAALAEIVKGAGAMDGGPQGVFVVGSGVDIPLIMPALAEVTSLPVSAPEQPATARAHDVAQARSPLFASATAFLNGGKQGTTVAGDVPAQAATSGPVVLEARGLSKSFGSGPTAIPIIHDINLRISAGEFIVLVGPSGSGKSTLLSILGLLEPPTSGEVLMNDVSVARLSARELAGIRGRRIGYVFQSFNLLAGLSVAENVMLPSLLAGQAGRVQYDRAISLLDQFGLAGMAKRVPAELSGGEQQRVAIARALFMAPQVVLADEPTGNLDTKNGRRVIDALYDLNAAGQTIVLVTHDRSIADQAPRLVSLLDGRIESDERQARHHGAAWRTPH